jgi:hypothetical protein
LPELPGTSQRPGKGQYQAEPSADESLFLARFGGVIHVAFFRHDCQIKQAEHDDYCGYD